MTPAPLLLPLLLLPLLVACGGSSSTASADCAVLLRLDGTTYRQAAFVPLAGPAPAAGMRAETSSCDDTGPQARGTWWPPRPRTTAVVVLDGAEVAEAIGDPAEGDSITVYVATGLSDARRAEVVDAVRVGLAPAG